MRFPLGAKLKRLITTLPHKVKVWSQYVGQGKPVFCIAEIGNNHNGDFELAKRTIEAAKDAGAQAVKFQRRAVEAVFVREMREMAYDNPRSMAPTYGEHRKKLELPIEQLRELKEFSESLGLVFFVTPFDKKSADDLESINIGAYKIASFDVTNLSLLGHVAKKGKPILLSTGGSTLEEIDTAIETILKYNNRLIVNHCTSMYPTPDENLDLNMLPVLRERYKPLPIGYSGHEPDFLPSVIAVALGASAVERHFTMDKTMRGSDHHMSIEPPEFKKMVDDIRRITVALGAKEKRIHAGEIPIREKHAKSLATRVRIPKGAVITRAMLTVKSPGTGLKPSMVDFIVGKTARYDIDEDALIKTDSFEV